MQIKETKNSHQTVLVIVTGFLLLYFIFQHKYLLYISLSVGLLASLSSKLAAYMNLIWLWIGKILGYIMPNIILSLFYLVILTPIAFVSRIFSGGRSFQLKNNASSLFKDYDKQYDRTFFEQPW